LNRISDGSSRVEGGGWVNAAALTVSYQLIGFVCLLEKVKLWWDAKRRQPGEKATLNLKSGAGSLCGLTTVDRSVTFTRPDLQLSESKVYDPLHKFHISSHAYPYQVTSDYDYCRKSINFFYSLLSSPLSLSLIL